MTAGGPADPRNGAVDFYRSTYSRFAADLYEEIRREAFGEDLGSNSWLRAQELDTFAEKLALGRESHLLDIACGAGGPAIRLAASSGCAVLGVDVQEQAVVQARAAAERQGLSKKARFELLDASRPLPFSGGSYDAILCVDAINHLPDRTAVLNEWSRLLRSGGRVLFTDPVVVTGAVSSEEFAARSAIGFYLFLPDGGNEKALEEAGFDLVAKSDATASVEIVARGRRVAREKRQEPLRRIEGDATFEGQQKFLRACEDLARERRLSRFIYLAQKRAGSG
jgi:cyclopropane fatty-acyl-phospholipid synthase-like methyltransferase